MKRVDGMKFERLLFIVVLLIIAILISSMVFAQSTDSDGDGLTDSQELQQYFTDPTNPDTDGDRINDGAEVQKNRNPLQLDLNNMLTGLMAVPTIVQPGAQSTLTLTLTDIGDPSLTSNYIPNIAVNFVLSNPSFGSLSTTTGTTTNMGTASTTFTAPNSTGSVTISAHATNLNNQLLGSVLVTVSTSTGVITTPGVGTGVITTPALTTNPRAYWVQAGTFDQSKCGNGKQDPGEECDDGNNARGDGCDPYCRLECGNGVKDAGEECGDPGTRGCPPTMECDSYKCKCIPKPPEPGTGRCCDGMLTPPEECEHGAGTMSIPPCLPFFDAATWSRIECPRQTCKCSNRQDPPQPFSAYCGDGYIQMGLNEECDDGNKISGDGCGYPSCQIEYCGDGILQLGWRIAVPHTPPYIFWNMSEQCEPPGAPGCDMFCQLNGTNMTNQTNRTPTPPPTPPPPPVNNTCPNMTGVQISDPAFVSTNISANASGFNDPDGDNASFNYVWYRNGVMVENYTIQSPIGYYHGSQTRGDIITVVVQPYDGYCYGNFVTDSVVIGNQPPKVQLFNDGPKWCGSDFTLTANGTDEDGDTLYYFFNFGDTFTGSPPPPPPVPVNITVPTPPPIHCVNNVWDVNESDIDCGGDCYTCPPLPNCPTCNSCWDNNDCTSGTCIMTNALPLPATDPVTNITYNTTAQIRQLGGQSWIIPYQGQCAPILPPPPPPPGNVTNLLPPAPVGGNYVNLYLTIGNQTYLLPLPPPLLVNGSSGNVTNVTNTTGGVNVTWSGYGVNVTYLGLQTVTINIPPFGNITITVYVAIINGQTYYFPPTYQPYIPPMPPGGVTPMSTNNVITHKYNTTLDHTFYTATVYVFDGTSFNMDTTLIEVFCNNATFGCAPPENLVAFLDDDLSSVNLSWSAPASSPYPISNYIICPVGSLNSTTDVSSSSPEFMAACNQFGLTLPSTLTEYKDVNAQYYPERYYKVMSLCTDPVPGAPSASAMTSDTVGKYEIPVYASDKFNEVSLPLEPYYNSVHEVFKTIGTGMGSNNAQYSPPDFVFCGAQDFIGNYDEIRTFSMTDFLNSISNGETIQQATIDASKLYDPVADCRLYSYADVYDMYTASLGELYAVKVTADGTLINVGDFVTSTDLNMEETDVYFRDNWFGYPLTYALNTVAALISDDEQSNPFNQSYTKIKHFNVKAYEDALAQNMSVTQAEVIANEDYVPNLPANLTQALALQQLMPGKGYRLEMADADVLEMNHRGNS